MSTEPASGGRVAASGTDEPVPGIGASGEARPGPGVVGDASWRAAAHAAQERALPAGSALVTCSAPLGAGGLGRHMREILDALDRAGQPRAYICEAPASEPAADPERELVVRRPRVLMPLTRRSPGWRLWSASVAFDRAAARRLTPAEHLLAFNGTALLQFRAAAAAAAGTAALVSATAHMRRVVAQQARAHRQYPLERGWAARVLRRNLAEYELAERIYVSTRYALESFLAEGIAEERLSLFPLTPHPRFTPGPVRERPECFEIVYVGGLSVDKGVPLLLDAFARLEGGEARLTLVGGWRTRGMRRHIQAACARDARIRVTPGDPLAHLRSAALYVHPTYCDGFAYAPVEAIACGVPVLVSEDTGMKELIDAGGGGLVVPTGDLEALTEALRCAYRGELALAPRTARGASGG